VLNDSNKKIKTKLDCRVLFSDGPYQWARERERERERERKKVLFEVLLVCGKMAEKRLEERMSSSIRALIICWNLKSGVDFGNI
jgi:hypothetical protein